MKIFIATKNHDKLRELKRVLEPMGFTVLCENDLTQPLSEVVEDGTTFEENALLKAHSALKQTGMICVADDSGLCVDALDGAPGLYSARYAGEDCAYSDNNAKLLDALKEVPPQKRTAKFVTAIACVFPDGREFTVRGECPGTIATSMQADSGFGYDPLFLSPIGCFALLTPEQKDSVSHRGKALAAFRDELQKYL